MDFLAKLVNNGLKKKPLIAKFREQFPKLSSSQICRFINNQLKLKVIEIDKKYKNTFRNYAFFLFATAAFE